ncbi:30S ribosomal protein S14 [Candidatus Woesearchaeota archaeon]|nr:30S ribosomal protein S14 [Candidatus Woesearchaeota archaeon]
MTTSDYNKVLVQLKLKPAKLKKWEKNNTPRKRKFGESTKKCSRCGRTGGHISKYGLHLCRQCFRDNSTKLGFKKFD